MYRIKAAVKGIIIKGKQNIEQDLDKLRRGKINNNFMSENHFKRPT
jgi:hypothetical protein